MGICVCVCGGGLEGGVELKKYYLSQGEFKGNWMIKWDL